MRVSQFFAGAALAGLALTLGLAIQGQIDPDPDFNPLALTVSDYAVADRGGATDWAMVTLALSTVALVFAMRGAPRLVGTMLCSFAAGMLVAAAAPTDPGLVLSTTGQVHRYASVLAFVVLPAAALLLARRRAEVLDWAAAPIRRLTATAVVFMLMMVASQVLAGRVLIGLAERLLLTTAVALLAVLAVRAFELGRSPAAAPWAPSASAPSPSAPSLSALSASAPSPSAPSPSAPSAVSAGQVRAG